MSRPSRAEPRPWRVCGDRAASLPASAWTCFPAQPCALPSRSPPRGICSPWPRGHTHPAQQCADQTTGSTSLQEKISPQIAACLAAHWGRLPAPCRRLGGAAANEPAHTGLLGKPRTAPGSTGRAPQLQWMVALPPRPGLGLSHTLNCPGCQGSRSLGFRWTAWSLRGRGGEGLGLQGPQHPGVADCPC